MENNANTEVLPEGTNIPAEINTTAQIINAEPVHVAPESNPTAESAQPATLAYYAKLKQFKTLLEYFVYHLEYLVDEDAALKKYAKFIENTELPESKDGKIKIGYRYGGADYRINDCINPWQKFGDGYNEKICLVVQTRGKKPNKAPKGCYLQWYYTGYNIKAKWFNNHIVSLYICEYREDVDEDSRPEMTTSLDDLGLFKNEPPNDKLKQFWKRFENKILRHNAKLAAWKMVKITDVLRDLIINNKNLILTGAPGTGKTYLAKQLACKLVGAQSTDDDQYKNHVKFVQFHPSYDYTDFVEGLRPVKSEDKDGQLGFERKDGTFKKLCLSALKAPTENFVMIIDEINRGQVSKILGELFFALDPDYRGKEGKVETQYQNMVTDEDFKDGFYVPEKIYVIGTMNDIDHSLEPLDFAFRRRFAWREITAKERFGDMFEGTEPFKSADTFVNNVKLYFERLNNKIGEDSGLGAEYQVGPAYFLKLKNFIKDIPDLKAANDKQVKDCMEQLWEYHLKPLLAEYLKGNSDTNLDIKKLHNAYLNVKSNEGAEQSGEQASDAQG